jgi:hypothetical protein
MYNVSPSRNWENTEAERHEYTVLASKPEEPDLREIPLCCDSGIIRRQHLTPQFIF